MRSFKKIIAGGLVFVTLFCLFSVSVFASYEGDFTSSSDLWTWLANQGGFMEDYLDFTSQFVGYGTVCPDSGDSLHHSSHAGNPIAGLDGKISLQCFCDDCGNRFSVDVIITALETLLGDVDDVQEQLQVQEDPRPFLTTPFEEYSVTEGLLLTLFLCVFAKTLIKVLKEGFYWLLR